MWNQIRLERVWRNGTEDEQSTIQDGVWDVYPFKKVRQVLVRDSES